MENSCIIFAYDSDQNFNLSKDINQSHHWKSVYFVDRSVEARTPHLLLIVHSEEADYEEIRRFVEIGQDSPEIPLWIVVNVTEFAKLKFFVEEKTGRYVERLVSDSTSEVEPTLNREKPRIKKDVISTSDIRDKLSSDDIKIDGIYTLRQQNPEIVEQFVFPYKKVFCLAIAINEYSNLTRCGISDIPIAMERADSFTKLIDQYSNVSTLYLSKEQATWTNIRKEGIGEHLSQASSTDLIIVYFAGHIKQRVERGKLNETYMLLADSVPLPSQPTEVNWTTGLNIDDFVALIQREAQWHHIIFLVDTCDDISHDEINSQHDADSVDFMRRKVAQMFILCSDEQSNQYLNSNSFYNTFRNEIKRFSDDERTGESYILLSEILKYISKKNKSLSIDLVPLENHNGGSIALLYGPSYPQMVPIPESRGYIGSGDKDENAWDDEFNQHLVAVPTFEISRTPITVSQYWEFIRDTEHPIPFKSEIWLSEYCWDPITRTPPMDKLDHPVVLVNYEDMIAYCEWLQSRWFSQLGSLRIVRLPIEVEYEIAARGQNKFKWPWGDKWSKEQNNCGLIYGGTTPVMKFPAQGPNKLFDLTGNVWEHCMSFYRPYPFSEHHLTFQPTGGNLFTYKGGSWEMPPEDTRISVRGKYDGSEAYRFLGFRVVIGHPIDSIDINSTVP